MNTLTIIQWFSVIGSLTGMILITYKNRVGFLFWIVSSCTWLYVFYMKDVGPRMVVEVLYGASAVYGFWKWGRPDKEKK